MYAHYHKPPAGNIDDQPDGMQQQTTISRHPFSCNISSASLQHLHLSFCAVKKRTTRRRQEGEQQGYNSTESGI